MITVGLTGGIGSGKSTIASAFERLGIPVFSSDREAKLLMEEDHTVKKQIIALFGNEVYGEQGLKKELLASKIFKDESLRNRLEKIVHPAVRSAFMKWTKKQNSPYVINESALIFEKNLEDDFDFIVLVTASEKDRIDRVIIRDGTTKSKVLDRINNQISDEEKIESSDFILKNDDITNIDSNTLHIHNKILKKLEST